MTSTAPPLPPVSEFGAMDPLDGLAVLSRYAEVLGHRFPPEYVAARRELAREARKQVDADGKPYSLAQIAKRIRRSKTLVWNLLTAGNPAPECAAASVLSGSGSPVTSHNHKAAGAAAASPTVAEATS